MLPGSVCLGIGKSGGLWGCGLVAEEGLCCRARPASSPSTAASSQPPRSGGGWTEAETGCHPPTGRPPQAPEIRPRISCCQKIVRKAGGSTLSLSLSTPWGFSQDGKAQLTPIILSLVASKELEDFWPQNTHQDQELRSE